MVNSQLQSVIDRIEKLEDEKRAIADDIREVYAEAKANGYDVKALREIIKLRKLGAAERAEREAVLDTYKSALGMLADTPLGNAAINRASGDRAPARATQAARASRDVIKTGRAEETPPIASDTAQDDEYQDIPPFLDRRHELGKGVA